MIIDTRRKIIAGAVALVVVSGGAFGLIALTNDDRSSADVAAQEGITPGDAPTTLPNESTTTTAPAVTTTTAAPGTPGALPAGGFTGTPKPKEAEPKQVVIRSPKRCEPGGEPTTGSLPGDSANGGKRWVTVSELKGSCDLQGAQFQMRGIDTRVVFRSDASNFNAWVVDTKTGIDGTAGYPNVQCTGPCADMDFLTDPKGTYYLRVQADGGPWHLQLQEYR